VTFVELSEVTTSFVCASAEPPAAHATSEMTAQ
jgi:hypothetical protein